MSNTTLADDNEAIDSVELTVPIACTMNGTGTSHTATLDPGTYSGASGSEYENGIGKTTLTAICNDDNGFSIYAIGFTGNSYDSENHTKLVGSNTGGTISTKAYVSGDTASNWSMKLTKVTDTSVSYNPQNLTISTGYDAWIAVPASFTKVAQYKANTGSSTTDTTLGVKLETTYAAYIASNQPADTYIGQVKYTMVHPYDAAPAQPQSCPSGRICYFANASDAVGTMGQRAIYNLATSDTLLASNFSRTGYGFAGWSDKFDYATNPEANFYGPQETITFTAGQYGGSNPGLSLYAVWVKSEGSLQDQSKVASVCNRLTAAPTDGTANLSSVSALTDQRDNNTYAIAKLIDGKCWMIENLRLEAKDTHGDAKKALSQGYGSSTAYGNFTGLADAESANFTSTNPPEANSLYSTDGSTANIIQGGNSSYYYARMPRYNNKKTQNRASNPTSNGSEMYSYGNYYTWAAAIASVKQYDGPASTDDEGKTSETANTSLCPIGWKLPRGGGKPQEITNDFWTLVVTGINGGIRPANYGSYTGPYYTQTDGAESVDNALRAYPNNFLYSGLYYTSSAGYLGSIGYYLSSTSGNNTNLYNLYLTLSRVHPGTDGNLKNYGYSIRCMADSGS